MPEFYSPLPKHLFRPGGGAAEHASRAIGNWWSDHAYDLMAPGGTPVIAVEDLRVNSVTRRPSTGTGVNDGSTVFATGKSGEQYAFLHLDPGMLPAVGQRLSAGHPFARIAGGTAGGPHLHFATERSDPTEFVKAAQEGRYPRQPGVLRIRGLPGSGIPAGQGDWDIPGDPVGKIKSVPEFLQAITNPHNILRGLQVIAGAVLVLVGVVLLVRQVALAADIEVPTPARVPLPGGRDLYQRADYAAGQVGG